MLGFEDGNIIQYRGYKIIRNTRTIWHKNHVSGHQWTTYKELMTCHVQGRFAWSSDYYRSVAAAKKHIDFLCDTCGDYKIVRSDREIAKARRLGLRIDD